MNKYSVWLLQQSLDLTISNTEAMVAMDLVYPVIKLEYKRTSEEFMRAKIKKAFREGGATILLQRFGNFV